jgi:hypothetical protein
VGAILLLEEGLGVFGGGNRTGDAGENRQGDECGTVGIFSEVLPMT